MSDFAKPSRFRSLPAFAAIVIAYFCSQARAAVISEVSLSETAGRPAYIEITLGDGHREIDLVILDAQPYSETTILQVIPIRAEVGINLVLIHEDAWPEQTYIHTQYLPVDQIKLGQHFVGSARRLVLFEVGLNWQLGTVVPHPGQWTAQGLPDPLDQISLQLNGWPVGSALDEPRVQMATDQAAWRIRNGAYFTDTFEDGRISTSGAFFSGQEQDPAQINLASHQPEPSSLAIVYLLSALAWGIGRNYRQPPKNTATAP